jgi:hypothetical protein
MNAPGANAPGMFQPPSLGRVVLVSGPHYEIPAIITAVWNRGMINATGFLFDGTLTSFSSISPEGHPDGGTITWKWPGYVTPVTLESLGFK